MVVKIMDESGYLTAAKKSIPIVVPLPSFNSVQNGLASFQMIMLRLGIRQG